MGAELLERSPADVSVRLDLGLSLDRIGGLLRAGGQLPAALSVFQELLANFQALLEHSPGHPRARLGRIAALQRLGRYEIKARRELRTVLRELEETGSEDLMAGLQESLSADILITGKFSIEGDQIKSIYKAVTYRTGSILATTRMRSHPLDSGQQSVQLEQSIRHAADRFLNDASDMTELHLAGIKFQNSGQQPEFGDYLESKLVAAISGAFGRKGHRIKVRRSELSESQLHAMQGTEVDRRRLQPKNFDPRSGVYVLTGSYWVLRGVVEIEVRLSDSQGAPLIHQQSVTRMSIDPGLKLYPESDHDFLRKNVLRGSLRLRLGTARGEVPVYNLKEKLNLLIKVDHDAWLYCFYLDSEGKLFKFYPNEYGKPAALAGNRLHTIPRDIRPTRGKPGFSLEISEPIGVDLIKCFASKRDILKELPRPLRSLKVEALPNGTAQQLRRAFARIRDAGVSEASLVLNINR